MSNKKHVWHLLNLDLRLIRRYTGLALLMFFLIYLSLLGLHIKSAVLTRSPVVIWLLMLGPFFNTIDRFSGEMTRYMVCGIDLTYVMLAKNLSLLILSGLGTIACASFLVTKAHWQMEIESGFYFSTTIFLLLTSSNYIFVFRKALGIKETGTHLRRQFVHGGSLFVASIPFMVCWLKPHSYISCIIMTFVGMLIWYITITRHLPRLIRSRLFEILEAS